ncbi:MAG: imidazole glycerol phosphate synthase cyclase subunit [Verrucomicrobiota bacterium]
MLKRRLIPKLQLKRAATDGRYELVTTIAFDKMLKIGEPISQAKIYQAQNVDELIFVDLDSAGPSPELTALVQRTTQNIFMPITIGGGVRTVEDFHVLLSSGADKVGINAAAVSDPRLISDAARIFGAQCVVVSMDFRKIDGGYRIFVDRGRGDTGRDLIDWARECESRGAGEILMTSVDRDGSKSGLELDAIRQVTRTVSIPVIAGGGCGVASHFVDGLKSGADAIAAGTYFCHQDQSPMQCRAHIKNAGFPIRLHL